MAVLLRQPAHDGVLFLGLSFEILEGNHLLVEIVASLSFEERRYLVDH